MVVFGGVDAEVIVHGGAENQTTLTSDRELVQT
jgi:hypothetical protein